MEPHQLTILQLAKKLETNLQHGLTADQIAERKVRYGANVLPETKTQSWLTVFVSQFKNPLIYILLIAATIIFFVGPDKLDAFIISAVLFFNAIIGTIQEGRTRTILESLKHFMVSECIVIRDGKKVLVSDGQLVPGDLILLQEGQRVPADVRIVQSNNIQIDESILTGESSPVPKNDDIVLDDAPLAECTNMAYKGTYILAGSGKGIVVATGLHTEIGKVHASIQEFKTDMPLKRELDRLSFWILIGIFLLCIVLFVIGFLNGKPLKELLVMLTALFICVVPEGLPVVLTLVLVSGVYRMAKQQVLVKHMQAVEGLGRTEVILVDKTGTLTRNEMMVTKIYASDSWYNVAGSGYHTEGVVTGGQNTTNASDNEKLQTMATAALLLNSAEISYDESRDLFTVKGDPTEAAMSVFAGKMGLKKELIEQAYKKIYEIPFESQLKYHAAFFEHKNSGIAFVIGSPETILQRTQITRDVESALQQLLDQGLRVVAVARKACALPHGQKGHINELKLYKDIIGQNLEFVGFFAIQDAIRPEVKAMVEQARQAGLKIIMVTGDHQKTALYVASQVGIFKDGDHCIDGAELEHLSDEELIRVLNLTTVYSRVSPQHKLRILKMFHRLGKLVAMTGDGINDAPSLVAADLGIAMGQIGTEVAKQASDIILLNDSFAYIIYAIEQGRHIFYTLRRVILYFFATNMGEVLIVLFALSLNLPLPITAAQILWLNLVTDGFLDVALSMEPQEPGLIGKGLLRTRKRLVDGPLIAKTFFMAVPMAIGSLWVFDQYYRVDIVYARTMTLLTMAMYQWFNAWNCRSERFSLLQVGLFSNRWLLLATTFVLGLQFLLIYAPFMHTIFKTVPLSVDDWLLIIAVTSPIVLLEELRKLIMRLKMARG